jgi:hypothetical protein
MLKDAGKILMGSAQVAYLMVLSAIIIYAGQRYEPIKFRFQLLVAKSIVK